VTRAAAGLLLASLLSARAALAEAGAAPKAGETAARVVCSGSPAHAYALYLPRAYTPERRWPVLYAFDARGQALVPLERFRDAAEEHGFVVASSYDTRSDGPIDPSLAAIQAMLADTHARLAVDDRRLYATGFSGGARLAALLGLKSKLPFAGVIGCGGGFLEGFPPEKGLRFSWFGTAGEDDFNYVEMKRLDRTLGDLGAAHGLAVFAGGHAWPPASVAAEALDFLEVQEIRRSPAPRDATRIGALLARRLAVARGDDEAGRTLDALRRYEALARDFEGLSDLAAVRARLDELRTSKEVKRLAKEDEKRDERDFRLMGKLEGALRAALDDGDPPLPKKLFVDLQIPDLKIRAEGSTEPGERASARRLLNALFVRTSFYLANEYRTAGDPARAALALTIATEIRPRDAAALYDLACARAVQGQTSKALEALKRSLEAGFTPLSHLETDPDLAALRPLPAYRELVESARSR